MTPIQHAARFLWRYFERNGWPEWAKKHAPRVLGWWVGSKGRKR